jgi:hypothetical protein
MVYNRSVPQNDIPVKTPRELPQVDSKRGKIIAYFNREGQSTFGKIEEWQFDMAGVLSYEVRNANGIVDYVSRWNFIGVVVIQ